MTLTTAVPIALLPVRLETRLFDVANTVELRVRVFPDTIHVDAHEPELTAAEQTARTAWLASARDLPAWRVLIGRVGVRRAGYVASLTAATSPAARDAAWTRAARARLLPDRFTFVVTRPTGEQVRVVGRDVDPALAVSLDPDDAGTLDAASIELADKLAWIANFDRAEAAGMAGRIALPAGDEGELAITVFGVRDRDPADEASLFEALLDAHHHTDGLAFLAPGTPTNHTADEPAPWSSAHATPDATYHVEVEDPGTAADEAVGGALARALGIAAPVFAHVDPGAEPLWSATDADAAAMQALAWPATIGYLLEQLLDGAVPGGPALIESVRQLFVERVRGRGPLPTLRIGRNPYGVVPVVPRARWRASDDGVDPLLVFLLDRLAGPWSRAVTNVPRIGNGDPDETFARVLATAPASASYAARSVLGASYVSYLYDFVRRPLDRVWWTAQQRRATAGWTATGLPAIDTRLARAVYSDEHFIVPGPIVQRDLEAPLAPNFLAALAAAPLEELRRAAHTEGANTPLLYRIARHGALAAYLAAARRVLIASGADRRREPELIGLSTDLRAPWTWLDERGPDGRSLRVMLDAVRARAEPGDPAFAATFAGLAHLATRPPDRLDATLRDALDVSAFRLDAWLTAIATARLGAMRARTPRGLHIGAYGFVERLVRSAHVEVTPPGEAAVIEASLPGGFVHAPSIAHATTAAILRSGHLDHGGGSAGTFAVDLRSARARAARDVVEAIRQGDSLGNVLGRELERRLLAAPDALRLWRFIPPLRALSWPDAPFPMRELTDGYALLKRGELPFGQHDLPAVGADEATALEGIMLDIAAVVDAVGDLLVAESVHQLAAGNASRAATVLDALARGEAPPAELGVLQAEAGGIGLTHRVLALVPADSPSSWPSSPRARAEPNLEAWAAAVLGAPATHRAVVRWFDAADVELGSQTVSLDALGISALDVVYGSLELEARVRDHVRSTAPVGARGEITDLDATVVVATALRDVLARGRAARAGDLGGAATEIDAAELEARIDDHSLTSVLATADPRAALLAAAAVGVDGAIPDTDPARWPPQLEAARAVIASRIARLAALPPPVPDLAARAAHAVDRIVAIFGDGFRVAPPFVAAVPALADSVDDVRVGDPDAIADWLACAASVHEGAGALERALVYADCLVPGERTFGVRVGQLPFRAGDRWIGGAVFAERVEPTAPEPATGRQGYAVHAPRGLDLRGGRVAGLLVDAWSEIVPAPTRTTAIALQVEQPSAAPPQAIVLAIPPDDAPAWTDDVVEAVVRETLELAKLRLVDTDALREVGHYLPALYFAVNTPADTQALADTASTDFTGVL